MTTSGVMISIVLLLSMADRPSFNHGKTGALIGPRPTTINSVSAIRTHLRRASKQEAAADKHAYGMSVQDVPIQVRVQARRL